MSAKGKEKATEAVPRAKIDTSGAGKPSKVKAKGKKRSAGAASSSTSSKTRTEDDGDYDALEMLETDCDPAALELVAPEEEGAAPIVRPFKLASVGKDFTQAYIGKRRGTFTR